MLLIVAVKASNIKQSIENIGSKCGDRGFSYDFDPKNVMLWKLVNSFKMTK